MKTFIKIILVLNLLVAFHRNLLYFVSAYKSNSFLKRYGEKTNIRLSPYVNYYSLLSGMETGYEFYSPNIPDVVSIVFTIQSDTGCKVCGIALSTGEGRKRFVTLSDYFNKNIAAREVVARSLATYMFHAFPAGQHITLTAYAQPIPTPTEYLQGIHTLKPIMIASYSFNKMQPR